VLPSKEIVVPLPCWQNQFTVKLAEFAQPRGSLLRGDTILAQLVRGQQWGLWVASSWNW